ncbi:MAG: nuclear transport factor 2 family protein [Acidimicrobiaceae bacterium]|nr:nuclear transport factor 2 family protein [Acidimicrobiaceae bacterium]
MPTATSRSDVARAFYAAITARDGEALERLLDAHFHDDAAVALPESLPYGGRVSGVRRLQRMFGALAGDPVPAGPVSLRLDNLVAEGEHVVALVSFDWQPPGGGTPVASSASELWTFRGGRVAEISAFYWDTAALVGGS